MERTESVERERTAPSPEVLEKPVRRRFTVEYKVRILAEADACTETGQLGELLRREGLYSSHLSNWRRQRDEGVLAGLTSKRRGRKSKAKSPLADENEHLRRENRRLKEQLRQAELIIDVQKKVSEMLSIPLKSPDGEGAA
jgi:transposase-like protein